MVYSRLEGQLFETRILYIFDGFNDSYVEIYARHKKFFQEYLKVEVEIYENFNFFFSERKHLPNQKF
jgi:hypothetical protein